MIINAQPMGAHGKKLAHAQPMVKCVQPMVLIWGGFFRHDESAIEKLSCTDVEQVWGTLKEKTMAKFEPSPLNEFCHVQKHPTPYKRPILEVTPDMEKRFRDMFLAGKYNSGAVSCNLFMHLRMSVSPTEAIN